MATNSGTWLTQCWHFNATIRIIHWSLITMTTFRLAIAAAALAGIVAISGTAANAAGACVNKAGEGTNSTVDGAKFQAWEAVLQATDWSVWSAMMATKQEVGVAPGMDVSKLRSSCKPGGLGQMCIVQATLCRK
jgi:hypothetical protein